MTVTIVEHPLAQDLLGRLRERDTEPGGVPGAHARARPAARRRGDPRPPDRARHDRDADGGDEGRADRGAPVAIPVLRAGLGLLDAVTDLYPDTVVGYLGMERDEQTLEPQRLLREAAADGGRRALILDPMLATGGSGSAAIARVKADARRPRSRSSASWPRRRASRRSRRSIRGPDRRGRPGPRAERHRVHPAGARRLRRSAPRDRVVPGRARARRLPRTRGRGRRRTHLPHEPGDRHDRDDERDHVDELGRKHGDHRRFIQSERSPARSRTGTRPPAIASGPNWKGSTRPGR